MKDNSKMKLNNKYILSEEKLVDLPSRLFRKIWEKIDGNAAKWKTYISDWARSRHPDGSDELHAIKTARSTTIGNITKEMWFSSSLTFNKLLTALSIMKFKKVKITITLTDDDDEEIIVEEETILSKPRQQKNKD